MNLHARKGGVIGGTLLVAGTCMGGGMISIPLLSGLGGLIPGFFMTTFMWLCMLATALLFLEATLGLPDGANIFSMSEKYFGKIGKYIALLYLLYFYALFIGYQSSVPIFTTLFNDLTGKSFGAPWGYAFFAIFFGIILLMGTYFSDKVNSFLMIGFFISLGFLIAHGVPHVTKKNFDRSEWIYMFLSGPLLFAAFAFHNLIPTLATYLNRDIKVLKQSIFIGMFISFLCYLAWQFVAIGSLSTGAFWEAFERHGPIAQSLNLMRSTPWFGRTVVIFSFFAITTSLIGCGLGIIDAMGDGFKWPLELRVGKKRFLICLLLFIPSTLLAALFPSFFFSIIGYAGSFGGALFESLLPILMVWQVRYHLKLPIPYLVPGGRILLLLLVIVTFYIVYIQGVMFLQ